MATYIFHIDVNSAYLSWIAVHRLYHLGHTLDLRTIPAVVGGDELSRHGIVLAKSLSAKAYGIRTGEPLVAARQKCPNLTIVPPDYQMFLKASMAMVKVIRSYSPKVQQFSVDECFVQYDTEGKKEQDPVVIANHIREHIKEELGFTVNIGVSTTKILAKMASDFQKPDRVHTLFPDEIKTKMWPLPVTDLFMVGTRTAAKLYGMGISTIGQLAAMDTDILYQKLKSYAYLIQGYANGKDDSEVRGTNQPIVKGMGNSTTVKFDVDDPQVAYGVLLSLSESVGARLRQGEFCAGLISVSIVSTEFGYKIHQRKLDVAMNSTTYIHRIAKELFDELWDGKPIRKLGVRASDLHSNDYVQMSIFENYDFERDRHLDKAVDMIRGRYGTGAIQRASFLHSGMKPMTGGMGEEGYPIMTSML